MVAIKNKLSVSACAAAVSCAFGFSASAQSVDSVQAGLDRAVKLPLEIIWLQSEIQGDMWRNPALAHALQGCGKIGTPKEGCGVSVRSPWRYSFDANSAVRAAPIVISSLNIPNAPFPTGRLNLTGSGRVYLITSAPGAGVIRPPSGAILLAAGSTVQLIDAAYPAIQIEVKAPSDQPLFLGNLAESDVTKVVALLVKQPNIINAGAADFTQNGQVALRAVEKNPLSSPELVQVAALSTSASRAEPDINLAGLAGTIEVPAALARAPEPFVVASIDLSALSGRLEAPVMDLARTVSETPALDQDFTLLAGVLESATPLPAPIAAPFAVASVDLSVVAGKLELPVREIAWPIQADAVANLEQDFSLLAGVVESSTRLPAPAIQAFAVASADLSVVAGKLELAVGEISRPPAPVAAPFAVASIDLSAISGKLEMPVHEVAKPAQVEVIASAPQAPKAVAAVAAAPIQVAMATPAPVPSSDITKMRAEIEAEIARERERMAQSLQGRAAKQFRLGT